MFRESCRYLLGLAIFFAIGTFCALVKARQVYFLVPLYFMLAWLTGELAYLHVQSMDTHQYFRAALKRALIFPVARS